MSDYNWCHGPRCHKRTTTNRVRGVKGSKVLRTIKINVSGKYPQGLWKYFCDQTCMHNFIHEHIEQFIALHPRPTPLETPIEVSKETRTYDYGYGERSYTNTEIKPIDNVNN